jgi:hypothetical protein
MLPRMPELTPGLTRRGVLTSAGALAVTPLVVGGCTRHERHVPTFRETLLDDTLALEESLLASYDAALAALGARDPFTRTLTHIRFEHSAHRSALLTAGAQPSPQSSATPTPPVVAPGDLRQMLIAVENAAATLRTDACLRGPTDLAPLLASLAASETAHAALLRATK